MAEFIKKRKAKENKEKKGLDVESHGCTVLGPSSAEMRPLFSKRPETAQAACSWRAAALEPGQEQCDKLWLPCYR